MDTSDWRTQLQPDSRQRIVNEIMETLKKHIPFSGQDGLNELWKIAQRFEEKIYSASTSQPDYLRKISSKMLAMETTSQNNMDNPMPSKQGDPSNQPPDTVSLNLMDENNWRPTQGTEASMDTSDWRTQLQPDSRQRIVNEIMETLKKHIPFSGQDGLNELWKIAQRFEEKIYSASTSQPDYLWKISSKMLAMETKSQNNMNNPMPSKQGDPGNQPPNTGESSRNPDFKGQNDLL